MPPPLARALAGAALACTLFGPMPASARVVEFTCTVTRLCPYPRFVRSSILPVLGKLGQA